VRSGRWTSAVRRPARLDVANRPKLAIINRTDDSGWHSQRAAPTKSVNARRMAARRANVGRSAYPPITHHRQQIHLLLGGARRFVRKLHCYYGRVRLLWSVHRRLRPPAFPARSLQNSARTAQRYPGSQAGDVCACQGLRRRGADPCLAIATWAVLPSAGRKASAPRSWFSPLNGWPTLSPVNASLRPSRDAAHDSGSVRFATPSPKRTFTSYLLPVSRRTRPPHHSPTARRTGQIDPISAMITIRSARHAEERRHRLRGDFLIEARRVLAGASANGRS